MEDSKIIELFWQREQAAIDETDRKYGDRCRYIANGILSSREEAEECVDDTYMAVWNSIPPQRPEHLSAWLYRIVLNLGFETVELQIARIDMEALENSDCESVGQWLA